MEFFGLPISTRVQKVIPKNAFDQYTNTHEKKTISGKIQRITWLNKISKDTTNLPFTDIQEIQIFKVELKVKDEIDAILKLIDKAIPYRIIFVIEAENEFYLSTSIKHEHPTRKDVCVIDWTLAIPWHTKSEGNNYPIDLKKSIDAVYESFCLKLRGLTESNTTVESLVEHEKKTEGLKKEISKLKATIDSAKQFNYKVEQNILLQAKEKELEEWKKQTRSS
jgi:hypothetical protein